MIGFTCDCGAFFTTWERAHIHERAFQHKTKAVKDPERDMENKEHRYQEDNDPDDGNEVIK